MANDLRTLNLKYRELQAQVRVLTVIVRVLITLISNEALRKRLIEWLRRGI